jgi:hypothetical protein
LRNLFHGTFQFFKIIDERMTVNKGTDSRDPDLCCFNLQAHLTFSNCCFIFLY